jgi:tellurite resistance protein TehA-like permease
VTGQDGRPGLAYLAAMLVFLVILLILGKLFLYPPAPRRPSRRLIVLALASVVPPATISHHVAWHSEGQAGWASPYMPDRPLAGRHPFQHA